MVAAEEQYPASDYQPTVVYSDADAASSNASSEAKSSEATASEENSEKTAEKAESSNTFLFGIVILAVAGGFFLSNKPKKAKTKKAASVSSYAGEAGGLTGVEKYVQAKNANAGTGVEKYIARKEAADQEASVTGVERYIRNRG